MRFCIVTFLVFIAINANSQISFRVDNFSNDYYGIIQIQDTTEVFSPGWIAIYDRETNKELIRVVSEELAITLHDGEAVANIVSLPYGEQSLVLHEDYNFDGKKDFAISDGQFSCYHGPSFQVYLATANGFINSKAFTALAQDYCGMFEVDREAKKLRTMTKSGCCWHRFTEFVVVNNKPKAVHIVTEDMGFPFHTTTVEKWNGKIMVSKTTKRLNPLDVDIVLSFRIPEKDKQVLLYNLNDRMLYYTLLKADSTVEFSYPLDAVYKNPDFVFDSMPGNRSVSFNNNEASYSVYEKANEVGVIIKTGGKTYTWAGATGSKEGSLDRLRNLGLDNLYIKDK